VTTRHTQAHQAQTPLPGPAPHPPPERSPTRPGGRPETKRIGQSLSRVTTAKSWTTRHGITHAQRRLNAARSERTGGGRDDPSRTIWFCVLAFFWAATCARRLRFGVGMPACGVAPRQHARRVMVNPIGPVWEWQRGLCRSSRRGDVRRLHGWYARLFSARLPAAALLLLASSARRRLRYREGRIRNAGAAPGDRVIIAAVDPAARRRWLISRRASSACTSDAEGNRVGSAFAAPLGTRCRRVASPLLDHTRRRVPRPKPTE